MQGKTPPIVLGTYQKQVSALRTRSRAVFLVTLQGATPFARLSPLGLGAIYKGRLLEVDDEEFRVERACHLGDDVYAWVVPTFPPAGPVA